MQDELHHNISAYLRHGILPSKYPSNKANFIRQANNYQLDGNGRLWRNGKITLLESEKQTVFENLHCNFHYLS